MSVLCARAAATSRLSVRSAPQPFASRYWFVSAMTWLSTVVGMVPDSTGPLGRLATTCFVLVVFFFFLVTAVFLAFFLVATAFAVPAWLFFAGDLNTSTRRVCPAADAWLASEDTDAFAAAIADGRL